MRAAKAGNSRVMMRLEVEETREMKLFKRKGEAGEAASAKAPASSRPGLCKVPGSRWVAGWGQERPPRLLHVTVACQLTALLETL